MSLDRDSQHIFAFDEPICFDFRRTEPHPVLESYTQGIPESDDNDRLRRVYAPLRPLVMEATTPTTPPMSSSCTPTGGTGSR